MLHLNLRQPKLLKRRGCCRNELNLKTIKRLRACNQLVCNIVFKSSPFRNNLLLMHLVFQMTTQCVHILKTGEN